MPQMIQQRQNAYLHLMELKKGFICLKLTSRKKDLLILWSMDVKVFSTQHLHFVTLSLIHRFILHHFFCFIVNLICRYVIQVFVIGFCLNIHFGVMGPQSCNQSCLHLEIHQNRLSSSVFLLHKIILQNCKLSWKLNLHLGFK